MRRPIFVCSWHLPMKLPRESSPRPSSFEFAVVLEGVSEAKEVLPVIGRILDSLSEGTAVGGHEVNSSTSVGIAMFPESYDQALRDSMPRLPSPSQPGSRSLRVPPGSGLSEGTTVLERHQGTMFQNRDCPKSSSSRTTPGAPLSALSK